MFDSCNDIIIWREHGRYIDTVSRVRGEALPFKKDTGVSRTFKGLKKRVFCTSWDVQPQKVLRGAFSRYVLGRSSSQ